MLMDGSFSRAAFDVSMASVERTGGLGSFPPNMLPARVLLHDVDIN
jgi:hypothetical protein